MPILGITMVIITNHIDGIYHINDNLFHINDFFPDNFISMIITTTFIVTKIIM